MCEKTPSARTSLFVWTFREGGTPVTLTDGLSGISTRSSKPSRLKADPTLPTANVAPFSGVPLLLSRMLLALPSPGYHATKPAGAATQAGGVVGSVLTTSCGALLAAFFELKRV